MTLQLSRREFLIAANATALVALIESCVPGAASHLESPPPGGNPYERALRLLRDAVRASPDHLAHRSADLVAARDADRIVDFVRDRIAVVPSWSFLDEQRNARRWGSSATLRGGQGTLRDRSELLAELLTRAGFPANVMIADRPLAIGLAQLYRPRRTDFVPDAKLVEQAKGQLRSAGAPPPASPHALDAGPDPAAAILSALPAGAKSAHVRPDLLPPRIPIVAFDHNGTKRYAIALGDVATSDTAPAGLTAAQAADPFPMATITVSAVSNPAPGSKTPRGRLVELVSAKWAADEIVGRQVLLTFVPPRGPKAYLESALSTQMLRVPTLRLQTGTPPAAGSNAIATGALITVQGDVSEATGADTSMGGPYGPVSVLPDAERKQAVARVASMKVTANVTAFPEIALEMSVVASGGESIDGLDGRSFSVQEDGNPVGGFTLLANTRTQQRPRVLVAYDTSSSVLQTWRTPAARAAFETNLGAALTTAAAQAPFEVQVLGTGTVPDPQAWVAPQTAAVAASLATVKATDETWATIAGPALDQGVVAVIMAGDVGDDMTREEDIPALQSRLAGSRVPVFCVPLGPRADAAVAKIVTISGGARVEANRLGKLGDLLRPLVAGWVGGAYRIRYVAPSGGQQDRSVTVSLAERGVVQSKSTYTVPAKPLPPPSFAGLYVTMQLAGIRVTRRVAGLPLSPRDTPIGRLDDPVAIVETRSALDGITTIAIEPGAPTSAAMLDDVLSSFISVEPVRAIWPIKDGERLLSTVKGGILRTPGILATLLQPTATDGAAVAGLKVAILQERAPSDALIERHADLAVGANPWIPVTTDAGAGFKAAVVNSVAACAQEAVVFEDSAYARLSGKTLVSITFGDLPARREFLKTVPAAKLDAWNTMFAIYWDQHVLAATGGGGDACWVVDPDTGAAKAVLLDTTGGARMIAGCHFSPFAQMAITLSMLSIMCGAAPDVFPVVCLGINSAAVAMTVASLFVPGEADAGTPFGAALGVINPLGGGAQFMGLSAAIGVALIIVTIQASCT